MECPDGTVLKFKRDHSLCKGFRFIDIENLQDHVFRPDSSSGNTVDHLCEFEPVTDFGNKVKALNRNGGKVAYMRPNFN